MFDRREIVEKPRSSSTALSSNFDRASTKDTKSKSKGFYKSVNMSVRTPFTNVNFGKEDSRYGGQNKVLRNWYD